MFIYVNFSPWQRKINILWQEFHLVPQMPIILWQSIQTFLRVCAWFCFEYQLSSEDREEQKEHLVNAAAFFIFSSWWLIQTSTASAGLQWRERDKDEKLFIQQRPNKSRKSLWLDSSLGVSDGQVRLILVQMWECAFFNAPCCVQKFPKHYFF